MMFSLLSNASSDSAKSAVGEAIQYISQGGIFMAILFICSLVSVATMIWKARALRLARVLPVDLEARILKGDIKVETLKEYYDNNASVLARLCSLVEKKPTEDLVEAVARRELTKLSSGINILEVIITIAPLLGLLGTASGLVTVFSGFGDAEDNTAIAKGIALALSTTITGLAVAVPSVIAHSYFSRKLETYGVRLELVLSQLILNLK